MATAAKRKANKKHDPRFNIYGFNMNRVGDSKNLIFIGKKKTGKSVLVIDYLYHYRDMPFGLVISPTDRYNKTFLPHVPSRFIYPEYSSELLRKFLKRQKRICRKVESHERYRRTVDTRAFMIFDDCLADAKEWRNDKTIAWIFMNGRHVKITFIITMQDPMGIPPQLRTNVDYIFICKEPKRANRRKLFEHWAGIFDTLPFFEKVLLRCTTDFRCLVIDNCSTSYELKDQVFWYKAKLHEGGFRTCYDDFWKDNDLYLPESSDSDSDDEVVDEDSDNEYKRYVQPRNAIQLDVNMKQARRVGGAPMALAARGGSFPSPRPSAPRPPGAARWSRRPTTRFPSGMFSGTSGGAASGGGRRRKLPI